ncbi:antibiotic biosynthesis monooxygenase [Gracilibacillus thailandensis]|uniref:Antibiotic biosynthesis monooxygenase n=1 Tax=Gracilibacillus thailandensis TaxID=563735 RepID=A0A6N7R2D6_9BACI|nr:antibiotic biosynthesis monooxygenase [Gracilibacillus thailandensis]MRI65016.1 antibiotic biosynthesis monooxygenase [Gracilibacillus thailandensis]
MNGYMTNGTYPYLEKLKSKHHIFPFIIMHNDVKAIAYYEDTNPSIFETSRDYLVLAQVGELSEIGFISLSHIPVTEEGSPIFEMDYKQKVNEISGVVTARLLRPFRGNSYILLVEWDDPKDYHAWKKTNPLPNKKEDSYIAGSVYTETFQVGEDEEE